MQVKPSQSINLVRESILSRKISLFKQNILSYEDTLKQRLNNKLYLLNKNVIILHNEKQKWESEYDRIQIQKVMEEQLFVQNSAKVKSEQKNIEFLQKQCQQIEKKYKQLNSKIQTKKQRNKSIALKTKELKQILIQQRRKLAQLTCQQQELINKLQIPNSTNKTIVQTNNQIKLQKNQGGQLKLMSKCYKSLSNSIKSQKIIHQFHLNLMRAETVKEQIKQKQKLARKTKEFRSPFITHPQLHPIRKRSSSFNLHSQKIYNHLSNGKQIGHKNIQKIRPTSLKEFNFKQQSLRVQSNSKLFPSLNSGFKHKCQAAPQSISETLEMITATTQTFYKFHQIYTLRNCIHKLNPTQLMNLIVESNILDKVIQIIEMEKVSIVKQYQKSKKPINKLKLNTKK